MADFGRVRILVGISALLLVLVISLGCARLDSNTTSSESAAATEDVEPTPLYHD
ncbi:MAG: hypothetical protein JRJ17_03640 [Deltaproteobacteria bacterium]|nr:hypothetical protein [Deltaproteobacteria bacterium]